MKKINYKLMLNFLKELSEELHNYKGIKTRTLKIRNIEGFNSSIKILQTRIENIHFIFDDNLMEIELEFLGKRDIVIDKYYFYFNDIDELFIKNKEIKIIKMNGSVFYLKINKIPEVI